MPPGWQSAISTKLTVSLVCKTHSKSHEELFDHFSFEMKKRQTIPPGTLNMYYILVMHTDNAQMSFVLIALCQPGGTAINFSKSARNQNRTTLLL